MWDTYSSNFGLRTGEANSVSFFKFYNENINKAISGIAKRYNTYADMHETLFSVDTGESERSEL